MISIKAAGGMCKMHKSTNYKPTSNFLFANSKQRLDQAPNSKNDENKEFDLLGNLNICPQSNIAKDENVKELPKQTIFERMAEESPDCFEDARMSKHRVSQIRMLDKCNVIFGLFGLMLSTQSYSLEYNLEFGDKLSVMLGFISVSCLINAIFMYCKKNYIIRYMIAIKQAPEGTKQFHVWPISDLIIEYIFLILAPSPVWTGYRINIYFEPEEKEIFYHLNDFLTIIMICKFVWLLKGLLTLSTYESDRGTRVTRMFAAQPGNIFTIKCLMRDSPFSVVNALFVGGVTFFGYLLQISESPIRRISKEMDFTSYINACWCTVATMTTVGYGDMYPRTSLGRLVMIICSMYGVIVVSLMVVTVTNSLCMSQMESASYTVMKKLEYKELIRTEAVRILVNVNRDHKGDQVKEEERFCKIKNSITNFRYLRRVYRNIGELNIIDEMTTMFNKLLGLTEDVKEILEVSGIDGEIKSEIKSKIGLNGSCNIPSNNNINSFRMK